MKKTLTESKRINIDRNSSKGNQLKWFENGIWYKADYLGYEALAEYVVSQLLKQTNVPEFVDYNLLKISYCNKQYNGCSSEDFLKDGWELITLEKLFRKYKGIELVKTIAGMDVKEKIRYVTENVQKITGLEGFGTYLTFLLELDAVFLNEDRHMHNIAVILDSDKEFRYCPIFDNGSALFSDTAISYAIEMPLEECFQVIESKPFSRDFDIQMDAAEELYGTHLQCRFSIKDVENIVLAAADFYPKEVIDRVIEVMRWQIRKYQYLMCNR